MAEYQNPGVYIEDIPQTPPSISSVETAIPAFIGFTEKAVQSQPGDLHLVPRKISSMMEYEECFGLPYPEESIQVTLDATDPDNIQTRASIDHRSPYCMHYALQLFFDNGGRECFIVSVGTYPPDQVLNADCFGDGLKAIEKTEGITLIVLPEAIHLPSPERYYDVCRQAMSQCARTRGRFLIADLWTNSDNTFDTIQILRRANLGAPSELRFGAAYYPRIYAGVDFLYDEQSVTVTGIGDPSVSGTLAELKARNDRYYFLAKNAISDLPVLLPVAPAVAGAYAETDDTRGVWKAPANIQLDNVTDLSDSLTQAQQDFMNVDPATGRSINAIRSFPNRGHAIIWGARTLAGNDHEWRYVPVRRFFNMVEESVRKGTRSFVFEPNDRNTWIRIRGLVENYLTTLWRDGALMGSEPDEAFYVKVGLGETMTQPDILEGRLIIEIGLAVVRPAEFIILRIMHKMESAR